MFEPAALSLDFCLYSLLAGETSKMLLGHLYPHHTSIQNLTLRTADTRNWAILVERQFATNALSRRPPYFSRHMTHQPKIDGGKPNPHDLQRNKSGQEETVVEHDRAHSPDGYMPRKPRQLARHTSCASRLINNRTGRSYADPRRCGTEAGSGHFAVGVDLGHSFTLSGRIISQCICFVPIHKGEAHIFLRIVASLLALIVLQDRPGSSDPTLHSRSGSPASIRSETFRLHSPSKTALRRKIRSAADLKAMAIAIRTTALAATPVGSDPRQNGKFAATATEPLTNQQAFRLAKRTKCVAAPTLRPTSETSKTAAHTSLRPNDGEVMAVSGFSYPARIFSAVRSPETQLLAARGKPQAPFRRAASSGKSNPAPAINTFWVRRLALTSGVS